MDAQTIEARIDGRAARKNYVHILYPLQADFRI
jgi:hypothetical protein